MEFKRQYLTLFLIFFLVSCIRQPFNSKDFSLKAPEEKRYQLQAERDNVEKKYVEQNQNKIAFQEVIPGTKADINLENLFSRANEFFENGLRFSEKGDWDQAEGEFENALECLQNSYLVDKYPYEVNKFYNKLVEDILRVVAKKEEPAEELKETILSATIEAKPEDEMTIKEKIALDLKEMFFDVPIDVNQKVIDYVEYFSTEKRESMERWLSRAGIYLPVLQNIFSQKGLPNDLTYLPLIESAFNPDAYSYAKACGLWQFIPGTAKKYGLKINWWIDERKDFEKSTLAAAAYLENLYEMFNDWRLALAAYNTGEGRVARAIQKQNTTNYWELNLHRQTMNYVPAFMASVVIAKNPKRYGFDITYETFLNYDTVVVRYPIDLKTLAECAGTSRGIIKKLNPELRSWTTPPNTKNYVLRIPEGSKERFETELAKLGEKVRVAWGSYRIEKGETLSRVARKFNVPLKALVEANSIRNPNKIAQGQRIIVPNRYERFADVSSKSQSRTKNNSQGGNSSIYTVKRGDTLSEISERYHVSVNSIKKWNNLRSSNNIYQNQKLKIYSSRSINNGSYKTAGNKFSTAGDNFKEIIYVVKKGDTLWNIAKLYNISAEEIMTINKISASNYLLPGEKLKLKIPEEL